MRGRGRGREGEGERERQKKTHSLAFFHYQTHTTNNIHRRPPAPTQSHDDLPKRLAEAPSALPLAREGAAAEHVTGAILPNDDQGAAGAAPAEAAFGRLAVSPSLERLPIRSSKGSSSADMGAQRTDASEWKRIREWEREREVCGEIEGCSKFTQPFSFADQNFLFFNKKSSNRHSGPRPSRAPADWPPRPLSSGRGAYLVSGRKYLYYK